MKYWSIRFCVCEMSIFSRSRRSGQTTTSDLPSMAIDPALGVRVGHQHARWRRGNHGPVRDQRLLEQAGRRRLRESGADRVDRLPLRQRSSEELIEADPSGPAPATRSSAAVASSCSKRAREQQC